MKVLVIYDTAYVNGGGAAVAIDSALGLAAAGVEVVFASAVGPADERLEKAGIKVFCTGELEFLKREKVLSAAIQGVVGGEFVRRFADFVEEEGPFDIVHLHSWIKAISPAIFPVLRKQQAKVVCTLHDYFSVCPNGGLLIYNRQSICNHTPMGLGCLACNCDSRSYGFKLYRAARTFTQDHIFRMRKAIDAYIYVSEYSRKVMLQYSGAECDGPVIDNPVPVGKFEYVEEKAPFALYAGRLSPEKGIDVFLEACEGVIPAVVIGDGPALGELKERFPGTDFLGWRDKETVLEHMRKCRAFVFPSLWHETNGLTVFEAMSQGATVLVSSGIAASELVEEGKTGLCFKRGDVEDLRRKLTSLANGGSSCGRAAYETFWSEDRSVRAHTKDLLEFYESFLAGQIIGSNNEAATRRA